MTYQGEKRERTYENIKEFLENTAEKFGLDPKATIRDHYFRLLEIKEIKKRLKKNHKVLDVGCGNGYSTIYYAQNVSFIIGLDYSKNFIKYANFLKENFPEKNVIIRNNILFIVGDAGQLPFKDEEFDVVIGERILINLPTREMQKKAIEEIHRVLKKGGLYISVEVTEQGHENVNKFRRMFGLNDLERYWHNLYIDENEFIPFVSTLFQIIEIKRFGMYHFISKVIHPLIVAPEEPKFESKINEVAMKIGSVITNFEDCSHQVMFILKKK